MIHQNLKANDRLLQQNTLKLTLYKIKQNNLQQMAQQLTLEQSLHPSQIVLFSRIHNHLLFHPCSLHQFWDTSRLCVTIQEFSQMLKGINFRNGGQQLQELKQCGIQFISLDKVIAGVNQWKKQEFSIVQFLAKQNAIKSQKRQYKQKTSKKLINQMEILNLEIDLKSQKSKGSSLYSKSSHASSKVRQNLAKNQQKQMKAMQQLNHTLIRAKNQSNYQLTIKIGQINDICKKLKNDLSYIIVTSKDGIQIKQRSQKTSSQTLINMKSFQRKYEQFKTSYNNLADKVEGTLQKDLKQTLVEAMYLSDELQKQINILTRKGISH